MTMQRIQQIQRYKALPEGTAYIFPQSPDNADMSRLVKFRIITEADVVLRVSDCEYDAETGEVGNFGESRLLTVVKAGFDEIEFNYQGSFALDVMGAPAIWLDTFENAFVDTEPRDFTNYARVWEREERDPRILEIERVARHNMMALQAKMEEDRRAYAAMLEGFRNVTAPADAGNSGAASSDPAVPAAPPAENPPVAAPAAAGNAGEPDAGK